MDNGMFSLWNERNFQFGFAYLQLLPLFKALITLWSIQGFLKKKLKTTGIVHLSDISSRTKTI